MISSERACYEDVVSELEGNQMEFCSTPCLVTEFKTEIVEGIVKSSSRNDCRIEYQFDTPVASKGIGFNKPFKNVKQEYLLMPLISVVGNIGGTLGMFIGFSFISATECVMEIAGALLNMIFKRRRSVIKPSSLRI